MPKWMATIDKSSPLAALGLAALLSAANPKNLLLAVRVDGMFGCRMNGTDVLVFTGPAGKNSAESRDREMSPDHQMSSLPG